MNKQQLLAVKDLFYEGKAVSNPAAWKTSAIVTDLTILSMAVITLLNSTGLNIQWDKEIVQAVITIFAIIYPTFHAVITVITSEKVGLPL